jgi:hypothetical protein
MDLLIGSRWGRLKSSGTTRTLDLLNGHFPLATYAGGIFLNMEADSGGRLQYGGGFWRQVSNGGGFRGRIYIWRPILEGGYMWRQILESIVLGNAIL